MFNLVSKRIGEKEKRENRIVNLRKICVLTLSFLKERYSTRRKPLKRKNW